MPSDLPDLLSRLRSAYGFDGTKQLCNEAANALEELNALLSSTVATSALVHAPATQRIQPVGNPCAALEADVVRLTQLLAQTTLLSAEKVSALNAELSQLRAK